jgi:general secretion pathway protein F
MTQNGVPLLNALRAAGDVVGSPEIRDALRSAEHETSTGVRLSQALSRLPVMDAHVLQLIQIGEESNRLDRLLLHAAKRMETELEARLERMLALATPLLTIVIGALIAALIMSVMQAILDVNAIALQ